MAGQGVSSGFARVLGPDVLEAALGEADILVLAAPLTPLTRTVLTAERLARQVLLTPHMAGVSPRLFWERLLALFLDNWARYRAGDPLRNLVDKQAGY